MKILFYLHRFPALGGIERVTARLANAFISRGHEVAIVSHYGNQATLDAMNLSPKAVVCKLPSERLYSKSNKDALQAIIKTRESDVVIFQDSYAPIERNLFDKNLRVPVIVCEHNAPYVPYTEPSKGHGFIRDVIETLFFRYVKQLKYFRDRRRRNSLYEKCCRYVLLSDRYVGEFKAVARLADTRKLRTMPNPVPESTSAIEKSKENVVLFVGDVGRRKGVDLLLRVWSSLWRKHPAWKLIIVGGGVEKDAMQKQASALGLENVSFEGARKSVDSYYTRARILSFPSRREGWPLVLFESMTHGCVPIVFDSYAAVHDIVENNVNGEIVPAFDVERYAASIEDLMRDEERLIRMSENAKQLRADLTIDHVVDEWERLLSEFAV